MDRLSTTDRPLGSELSPSSEESDSGVALWRRALEALELHHAEVRGGLQTGVMPEPYSVALPSVTFPPELAEDARRIRSAQRDIEGEVRERLSVLGTVLSGAFPDATPAPHYLDRRG